MQRAVQMEQLIALPFHELCHWNTGPALNDAGDFLIGNLIAQKGMTVYGLFCSLFFLGKLLLQLRKPSVFQLRRLV